MKKWNEMTREEIKEAADAGSVVIVTIGATEQHGPHLPVNVDNQIVQSIAYRTSQKIDDSTPVIIGPHIPFGYSEHHFLYAGAISISEKTLMQLIVEVIESVLKSGFTKVILLNSHGGNRELIRMAARDVHRKSPQNTIVAASYWEIANESLQMFYEKHKVHDVGHAGQFETSIMLAIDEHVVKEITCNDKREAISLEFPRYITLSNRNIWEAMDGYSDDPSAASKELGNDLLDLITNDIIEIITKIYSSNE